MLTNRNQSKKIQNIVKFTLKYAEKEEEKGFERKNKKIIFVKVAQNSE